MKTAFRHLEDRCRFRVSEPPATESEDWEQIQTSDLTQEERNALGIERATEEFVTRMKELEREVDGLKAKIRDYSDRVDAVRGAPKVNLVKLIRAIIRPSGADRWRGAEYEREVVTSDRAMHLRTLAAETDAAGGYLVPPEFLADQFIELLRANTIIDKLPIMRLTDLVGAPVTIPQQTSGGTAYWVGEGAAPTNSTQGTGNLNLRPRCLAGLTYVSKQLIAQASQSAETFVQRDLARVLGIELTNAAINGHGGSGQPVGVLQTAGINKATGLTGTISYTDIWDMQYMLEADEVDTDMDMGAVLNPQEWNNLRKGAAAAGTPKSYPGVGWTPINEVVGMPVVKTTKIAAGTAIVGKWSDFIVGEWGGLALEATDQSDTAFKNHQVWIKATQMVDFGVRHPVSFCSNASFT